MQKITIVGAGRVGESTAQFLASSELARELVLVDVREGAAEGAALDVRESAPIFGFDTKVTGTTDPAAMAGSNVVIITAGKPRQPGQSRSDVLGVNLRIVDAIMADVVRHAPQCKVLVVTNPVDVLTYRAWKTSGWPRSRVFGQAGVLDSIRMASFISMETGFSVKDVAAMVLGGHGDSMVPLPRYTTINGIPIERFVDQETLARIIDRTRKGGAEILALRKVSSAYDAPAAAIEAMTSALAMDRRRILPTVAVLDGEYGQRDIAMGVPAILSWQGVEKVVELDLTEAERAAFARSADALREDLAKAEAMGA